jgi:hypothetical protein
LPDLLHLTILTGDMRMSPRSEVADHVVSGLRTIIAKGGGAVGNTGWAVLIVERSSDGAIFDLSHRGVELARCFLAITLASEQRLWEEASAYPTLPDVRLAKPTGPPWLAVGLLPDGMALLGNQPALMARTGRFRALRRLGAVGESVPRTHPARALKTARRLRTRGRLRPTARPKPFRQSCVPR